MKVLHLSLHNFRGIDGQSVDFTQSTTAFVGVNGVGKSAVLEALAIALSQLTWRLNDQPQKARPIALDDIRHGADFARSPPEKRTYCGGNSPAGPSASQNRSRWQS